MGKKTGLEQGIGLFMGGLAAIVAMPVAAADGVGALLKGENFADAADRRVQKWGEAGQKFGEENAEGIAIFGVGLARFAASKAAGTAASHYTEDYLNKKHHHELASLSPKPDEPGHLKS